MQLIHLHDRRRRARGAAVFILAVFTWLTAAFYRTQILQSEQYTLHSDMNRLRPLPVPAPRGAILDRHGELIAENLPGYALSILPAPHDSIEAVLFRLAPHLQLNDERIEQLLKKRDDAPTQPLRVSVDLSFDQLSAVEERRQSFATVLVEMLPKRQYATGAGVGHLVGYVAEISREELAKPEYAGYSQGQVIGKAGLEKNFERHVAGRAGTRYVEVDARGRIVGAITPRPQVMPVPGNDLHLYIDLGLQRWIERIFPDSMMGAMVAMEPGTGRILAFFSSPDLDPNEFIGGISSSAWKRLNEDPHKPLLQRVTGGTYPPASTFKLITSAIGLELGVVTPKERMAIPCRGGMQYGSRYFRCWKRDGGHGFVDMPDAIATSCDVYFYQLGLKIGLSRFLAEGTRLGFSQKTQVDFPIERSGTFPDTPEWFRKRFGWKPTPAEVLSLAIGQGPNDQTVLKMTHFFAALAADGHVDPPRLAREGKPLDDGWDLTITKENLAWLREGMRRVVAPGGTAHLSSLEHWDLIGKTGTAQNSQSERDHGWFVGMAGPRGKEPEIVVGAIVEFADHGSDVAKLASKAADYYLRTKHGIPVDSIQTLYDHLMAGKPAPWAWR